MYEPPKRYRVEGGAKDWIIQCRVTTETRDWIERMTSASGLSRSAWLRGFLEDAARRDHQPSVPGLELERHTQP